MFSSSDELCLIDAGITDLSKLPVQQHLRVLNLHANHIERIQNIGRARFLVHLDLSSNRIQAVENLSQLVRLKTLNLSCNCIRRVSGLGGLHSLANLDLSYNCLENLDGFLEVHGPQYQLRCVKLHGNQIASAAEVSHCLTGCQSLSSLMISNGTPTGSNPMCRDADYAVKIFTQLPQLARLDGRDVQGRPAEPDADLTDVPGLESYSYDELLASPKPAMITPKIDAALNAYHRGKIATSSAPSDLESTAVSSAATKSDQEKDGIYEGRLRVLEEQLSDLLRRNRMQKCDVRMVEKSSSDDNVVHAAKRDVDNTDESDNDRLPQTSARTAKASRSPVAKSRGGQSSRRPFRRVAHTSERGPSKHREHSSTECPGTKYSELSDRKMRDDLRATYVQLMKELEGERERRSAAEETIKRVTEQLEHLTQKAAEDHESQQTALDAAVRLKRALVAEKETHQKTRATVEVLREKTEQLQQTVDEKENAVTQAHETAKLNHDTAAKAERENLRQIADLRRLAQESQLLAAGTTRELELVKSENTGIREQIRQLQALLADREKAHQQEIAGKHPLNSQAVDDVVAKALAKAERDRLREEHAQSKKYNDLAKKYSELEDEFRIALQIELDRFKELQVAFEQTSSEAAANKAALEVARHREDKSVSTVSELSALVREQKARLAELSRSKSEQVTELRERIQQQEAHLDEARRRMIQLEMLKKEHEKLQAALHGQESLVAGLREERKVWSDELAQQGAALAHDRGRLESRIEALHAELSEARKRSERDQDAIRIKTKVTDDQTETIRTLKEAVVERDEQIRDARAEHLRAQREMESQLSAEAADSQSLSEQLSRERSRRDELKTLVNELQTQLSDEQNSHALLQDRWREKTDAIAAVERQVQQMKSTWDAKERKLTEERDKAVAAASAADNKLRQVDDAFRRQLDNLETSHREAMAQLMASKDAEVEAARSRTTQVEEEMRVLLREMDDAKQNMDARIRKLTAAFADLQQDFVR